MFVKLIFFRSSNKATKVGLHDSTVRKKLDKSGLFGEVSITKTNRKAHVAFAKNTLMTPGLLG